MTLPDWNSDDYLVDFEDIYYSGPIIHAPLPMKIGKVMKYLHDDIFPQAIRAVVNGSEIAGILLAFSIVDYLSGYFMGKSSTSKEFISFLDRYFPNQYTPFAKDIYNHLRSGLVHNLVLQNPWKQANNLFIVEKRSDTHLQIIDGKIIFSIYHFIEDTRRAEIIYFYDLIMKPNENVGLVKNFNKRFNKQDGAASGMIKTD